MCLPHRTTPPVYTSQPDSKVWTSSPTGEFSVKSTWNALTAHDPAITTNGHLHNQLCNCHNHGLPAKGMQGPGKVTGDMFPDTGVCGMNKEFIMRKLISKQLLEVKAALITRSSAFSSVLGKLVPVCIVSHLSYSRCNLFLTLS